MGSDGKQSSPRIRDSKRARLIALITAVITAATPGIYSAYETAKQSFQSEQEKRIRDQQEIDLQKYSKANKQEIELIKQNCVSHKQLLQIVLQIKKDQVVERRPTRTRSVYRPQPLSRRDRSGEDGAVESHQEGQLQLLQEKAKEAEKASKKSAQIKRSRPSLKSIQKVRELVQKRLAE